MANITSTEDLKVLTRDWGRRIEDVLIEMSEVRINGLVYPPLSNRDEFIQSFTGMTNEMLDRTQAAEAS